MTSKSMELLGCIVFTAMAAATPKGMVAQERPIQVALVNPIQIFPEDQSIRGLRLNILYGRNASVTGLDIGLVNHTTAPSAGLQYGLVGLADSDFRGWQNHLVNVTKGRFEGF